MTGRTIEYVVADGTLRPVSRADIAAFSERFADGEIVSVDIHPLQRKFWAICRTVIKENDKLPWDTAEELADALKRAAGHVTTGQTLAGKSYLFARSLGDVADFPAFFDKAIDALAAYLGVDPKTLTEYPKSLRQEGSSASAPLSPDTAEPDERPSPSSLGFGDGQESETSVNDGEGSSTVEKSPGAVEDRQSETSTVPQSGREGPASASRAHTSAGGAVSTDDDYSPKMCMEKLLGLGNDREAWQGHTDDHIKQIDAARVMWMKHIRDLGFVYQCAEQAIKVAQGKVTVEDARRRLLADLPK